MSYWATTLAVNLKIDRQGDARKQRDLSVSFNKLGDVYLTLGRTEDALKQYQDGLKIRHQLAADDPKDAQKQRDLSISLNNLGDVYLTLGRTEDALKQYQDGLKISRQLATDDPKDAQKQRDLSISFDVRAHRRRLKRTKVVSVDGLAIRTPKPTRMLGDVFLKLGHTEDA